MYTQNVQKLWDYVDNLPNFLMPCKIHLSVRHADRNRFNFDARKDQKAGLFEE